MEVEMEMAADVVTTEATASEMHLHSIQSEWFNWLEILWLRLLGIFVNFAVGTASKLMANYANISETVFK